MKKTTGAVPELREFQRKNKIDIESAKKQVQMLCDYYDVDLDFIIGGARTAVEQRILGLTKSVARGRLSIEKSGDGISITQYLEKPIKTTEKITFKELDSTVRIAVRNAPDEEAETDSVLGALSELGAEIFEVLSPVDRTTAYDLGQYFLFV